jgi:N-methylhydantoinase A
MNAPAQLDGYVGVDVGGTHTDVTAIVGDRVERGKALTTYDDFSRGVLDATSVAAANLGLGLDELMARTRLFVNGTTVVTNAITELRGSNVGVLITAGFRDTFRMAGGPRLGELDDHLQFNVPDLVPRSSIVEVDERIDHAGRVLLPLDPSSVAAAVDFLVEEQGVEAIAICFLSSYSNPEHELAAEAEIKRRHPEIFVTPSHRVFPVRGENRRWTTAVLNSFVQDRAEAYLESLSTQLTEAGLGGNLAFFQGLGGGISAERAKEYPLALLGSGPAGGAIGAHALARRMGHERVLLGDMGGTSFDTGIIHGDEVHIDRNLQLGQFATGVNLVDVVSVGAGGGSIVWVGERGIPQVGPQSARSTPGPACLGRGGTEPTVTDAMVAMGFIDPDRYLNGRVKLQPELAQQALDRVLSERYGWSTLESAAAVHDLVVVNMATAMREISVEKGFDPREFVFLAYGGTLPMFAAQIAEHLDISTIVIPRNSSVFCALGVLSSDYLLRSSQTLDWNLADAEGIGRVNATAEQMVQSLTADMRGQGFAEDEIEIRRTGEFRFMGQSYELSLPLPDRDLTPEDAAELGKQFFALYERTYGEGTAWKGVPETLVNYTVTVIGRQAHPDIPPLAGAPVDPASMLLAEREVFLPGERRSQKLPVYDDARFTTGTQVEGPAIVDAADTTIYVPPGTSIRRDEWLNYVLIRGGAR